MNILTVVKNKIQSLNLHAGQGVSTLYVKIEPLLARVLAVVRRLASAVFGQWQAPVWLHAIGVGLGAVLKWCLSHLAALLIALGVGGAVLASGGAIKDAFFGLLPERTPMTAVKVSIDPPRRTEIENGGLPAPVVIKFSASAAPLTLIGKQAMGVSLSPAKEGVWQWVSGNRLTFQPKDDWPVGLAYRVKINDEAVAKNVELDQNKLDFTAPQFNAKIDSAEFYQDPVQPTVRRAVYQITLSHPVNPAEFEKKLSLSFNDNCQSGLLGMVSCSKEKAVISFDAFKQIATIQSAPLAIPLNKQSMTLRLSAGLLAMRGGEPLAQDVVQSVEIPSLYSLAIPNIKASIVSNDNGEPEHVVHVAASMPVHEKELARVVQAWLLPVMLNSKPSAEDEPMNWTAQPEAITEAILKRSNALKLEPIAGEREVVDNVSFKIPKAEGGRYLLLRVAKGLKTPGGYQLGEQHQTVLKLKTFAPELSIMSQGSLLALSGEKKVGVLVRDLPGIQVEIGRLLPQQLQHLVTQSQGEFSKPEFYNRVTQDNLSERFETTVPLTLKAGKAHYETVDFGKYLKDGKDRRGVFLLTVKAYDPEAKTASNGVQASPEESNNDNNNNNGEGGENEESDNEASNRRQAMGKSDKRLILVTDLGMVIKKSIDGSREVFVQSIASGKSVDGAVVEVWGRNGAVVMSQPTDNTGRAKLTSFAGLSRERAPVVVVVRKDGDLSFLPLNRSDRNLDMSRFDVGGLRSAGVPNQMTAYLFSDRGIYRPGDTMNIGLIVKAGSWGTSLKDLPVEAEIVDARGLTVRRDKLRLGAGGAAEISHTTQETSPTGNYTVNLFLPKDNAGPDNPGLLLGSTTVKVQEFMPDRSKVTVKLNAAPSAGWIKHADVKALINVQNLFGTPASNRRVDATLTLSPAYPAFKGYSEYAFYDPSRARAKSNTTQSEELGSTQSSESGDASFDLNLERFEAASYQLHVLTKAFEPEGGRSVSAETSAMVSDLPHLVGIKTDGNTQYISKDAVQTASVLAINPAAQKIAIAGLKIERIERKMLSVLIKQSSGVYRYESRLKEVVIDSKPFAIAAAGSSLVLNTSTPGNFSAVIRDAQGIELNRVDYSVAGTANVSRSLDRNAELQLSLNKKDYNPGEDIEISVRAPYVGAGLITIERDKVYSHTWFKTDKTASVQKITLPKDFEGTGYVNVHFVRDMGSDEIYMSPLSYGAAPFATSLSKRTANITLTSSELIKPGQAVKMKLTSDKPTRAVVFAVDEGILQVARYKTPDPLAHFFQKRALEVSTMQTLDLILPEFKKLMRGAAPGGDGEGELGKHLNPFKRKRDKPVAFWSGIVDVNGAREFSYTVPESFNGTLRVMAVVINDDAVAAKSVKTTVRGDMVILPNIPVSLAPGDSVEVGVGLANNILNSGKEVPIALKLETTGGIEIVDKESTQTLKINERSEGSTRYQIRAKQGAQAQLGSGSVIFTAQYKGYSARLSTDVSIRPASPYVTLVQAGSFKGGGELKSQLDAYPNYRKSDVAVSAAPWAFGLGLMQYLEAYPHGCTEQITSQTLPAVLLANRPELYAEMMRGKEGDKGYEKDAQKASQQTLQRYIVQLRGRQAESGGFALWPGAAADTFATVYAVQLLVEAKERKLAVPADMLQKANAFLQSNLSRPIANANDWRQFAQALYVLARQGVVAPAALANLREFMRLEANKPLAQDLGAVYLAASYQLLKQDTVAAQLLQPVWTDMLERHVKSTKRSQFAPFYDPIVHDSMLLHIVAKHFPAQLKSLPASAWTRLAEQLKEGWYNSLSSASMLLAIDAYFQVVNQSVAGKLTASALGMDGKTTALALGALNPMARVAVPVGTASVKLSSGTLLGSDYPLYYAWAEQGFERNTPTTATSQGMEIIHEVVDAQGKPITQAKLGDEVFMRVRVRSLNQSNIANVALVDVLPGGLEPVLQASSAEGTAADAPVWQRRLGGSGSWRVDYADIREDRVVFYGSVGKDVLDISYKVRATNVGQFIMPAAYGEAMYDRRIFARSAGGAFTVVK